MRYLLKNLNIVNEGLSFKGGLFVDGELIGDVYSYDDPLSFQKEEDYSQVACVMDMEGLYAIPGIIDTHVHFREPGAEHKATIETESAAAVAGGVASFIDMPNNNPSITTLELLQRKVAIASRSSYANYAFYIGATNNNLSDLEEAIEYGAPAIKVFLGSSTGNLLADNDATLERIFNMGALVAVHCEDNAIIAANTSALLKKYGDAIPFFEHANIRSREACIASTAKAIDLALRCGTALHILHISTAEEVEMIEAAQKINPLITGEACVAYLWFTSADYACMGSHIKCNPSIKEASDRDALIKALRSGVLSNVATDHAPHTLSEKDNDYMHAPSGIPMVQYSLPLMLELAAKGYFSYAEVVRLMAHNPAELYKIDRRGFLRKGFFADIAIFDPCKPSSATPLSKCGWTPVQNFSSSVVYTFINGTLAFADGVLTKKRAAQRLTFCKKMIK